MKHFKFWISMMMVAGVVALSLSQPNFALAQGPDYEPNQDQWTQYQQHEASRQAQSVWFNNLDQSLQDYNFTIGIYNQFSSLLRDTYEDFGNKMALMEADFSLQQGKWPEFKASDNTHLGLKQFDFVSNAIGHTIEASQIFLSEVSRHAKTASEINPGPAWDQIHFNLTAPVEYFPSGRSEFIGTGSEISLDGQSWQRFVGWSTPLPGGFEKNLHMLESIQQADDYSQLNMTRHQATQQTTKNVNIVERALSTLFQAGFGLDENTNIKIREHKTVEYTTGLFENNLNAGQNWHTNPNASETPIIDIQPWKSNTLLLDDYKPFEYSVPNDIEPWQSDFSNWSP